MSPSPDWDEISEINDVLGAVKEYAKQTNPSIKSKLNLIIETISPWSLGTLHQELSKNPEFAAFSEYLQTHGITYPDTQPTLSVPTTRIAREYMEIDTTTQEINAPHFNVQQPKPLDENVSTTPKLPIKDLTDLENNVIKNNLTKTDPVAWHKKSVETGNAGFDAATAEESSSSEATFFTHAVQARAQENGMIGLNESIETRLADVANRAADNNQTLNTSIEPAEIHYSVFPRVAAEQAQLSLSSIATSTFKHTFLVAATYALDSILQNVRGVSSVFATAAIYTLCAGVMALWENPSRLNRVLGSSIVWMGAATAISTLFGTASAAIPVSASLTHALAAYPSLVENAISLSAKFHYLAYVKLVITGAMAYDLHRPEGTKSVSYEVAQFVGRMATTATGAAQTSTLLTRFANTTLGRLVAGPDKVCVNIANRMIESIMPVDLTKLSVQMENHKIALGPEVFDN